MIGREIVNVNRRKLVLYTKVLVLAAIMMNSANLFADVIDIGNDRTQELLDQGVPIIDVRTPPEWQQTGVIEGSHLLTFFDADGSYDVDKWLQQLRLVASTDEPLILICEVGGRTNLISRFLDEQLGYTKVHNVERGIRRWIDDGRPTVAPQP